ncbi:DUF4326 domain-containing protein [Streptomyces chiangmaiensis]|uniref:DUF4326 domain-containing protein n=1 Tax=Streptomyces chiangmaiensis TaxID=766497 RepID=A0ABU7FSF9_9ACTN|nr:DUF4326 domain-containing protein [Streptomyces chiangmaiensis]MED7826924.1 DUF4326 domain-containing protein [Streptomyces chiangmaiensis]
MINRRAVVTGSRFAPCVPEGAVYAGREAPYLKRSPYANPHVVGTEGRKPKPCQVPACEGAVHDRAEALALYAAHLDAHPELVDQAAAEPAHVQFACRCKPSLPCHVDVLLARIAARTEGSPT